MFGNEVCLGVTAGVTASPLYGGSATVMSHTEYPGRYANAAADSVAAVATAVAAAAAAVDAAAGDYGSMVNERVGAGNWESSTELGDTWAARNAFSYGKSVAGRGRGGGGGVSFGLV